MSVLNFSATPNRSCHADDSAGPSATLDDLAACFQASRDRLKRLVTLRLDRRLAARIDPSDIVQETFIRASAAFEDFQRFENPSLYHWLRMQAQFAVGDCHRRHLATRKRSAASEKVVSSDLSINALEEVAHSMLSPGSAVANRELADEIRSRISGMSDIDREILLLRHVEELTITEAATELGIPLETAKKRHLRAIRRLQELCQGLIEGQLG
ncbi:MAG: sigma-70 family RNA polymerase sigma factor [Planctomyces sp.]|jgi:RNA polymerase sigma-70 factor (ECF subfamily)